MQRCFARSVLVGVVVLGLGIVVSPVRADEAAALQGDALPAQAIWLDSLDVGTIEQGWRTAQARRSVGEHAIKIHGAKFAHGVGTHAESLMDIDLKGAATRFAAMVGIDDETDGKGIADFEVWVDGKKVADSGFVHGNQAAKMLTADLRGAKWLTLLVSAKDNEIDFCHADWAGAWLELSPAATARPAAVKLPAAVPPLARENSPQPAIHSPRITGATPGRPFLFLVPATGQGPLTFSAGNLPAGLVLDPATGIIRRIAPAAAGNDGGGTDREQRLGPGQRKTDHRRRPAQAGPDAADGLELLELLGRRGERRQGPRRRRRHGH